MGPTPGMAETDASRIVFDVAHKDTPGGGAGGELSWNHTDDAAAHLLGSHAPRDRAEGGDPGSHEEVSRWSREVS